MKVLMMGVSMFWGFASGIAMATGIMAFINAIGIIPRLATKTRIQKHYFALGNASLLGVIVGNIFYLWEPYVPVPKILIALFGLAEGIFIGCLAIALAEILNVIPITRNRLKIKRGVQLIIFCFALGKMVGTLYYWIYPNFF